VLEVASLQSVGHSRFSVVSRAAVIDLDPEVFEGVGETLSRRHSIVRPAESEKFPDGTVSACYEFVHALYREVCYRRIGPGRRAQLHRRTGQWAEAHNLERVDEVSAVLAGHFEQGGDWMRAIKYLGLAADTAGRRFEPRQAAEILEHALEFVSKLPEAERTVSEIEILEKLGANYLVLLDDKCAIETYEVLAARAAQHGLIDVEVRGSSTWRGRYRGSVLSVRWKSWNGRFGSTPGWEILSCGRKCVRAVLLCAWARVESSGCGGVPRCIHGDSQRR